MPPAKPLVPRPPVTVIPWNSTGIRPVLIRITPAAMPSPSMTTLDGFAGSPRKVSDRVTFWRRICS